MIRVTAPASTANLGSGFDCMGIALKLYNIAEFEEIESGLEINILDDSKKFLPTDQNNYIYKCMERVFNLAGKYPKGIRINVNSSIPVTRGLGSSSAGLALGLAGANELIGSPFTREELLNLACDIEGHPDNVTPAFCGGFTVAVRDAGKLYYTKTNVPDTICFAAMIPDFYLPTKRARGILPKKVFHRNAVYNVAHASYFAACASKGDFSAFGIGAKDRLHQKYRFGIIKNADEILRSSRKNGAIATFLSGAGPTIISVVNAQNASSYQQNMQNLIDTRYTRWHLEMLEADNYGLRIEK